jgi:drug/metabolite transporter (DMT)-like permease
MPLTATALVLISTFMHAGWNLLVGSQPRTSYTLLRIILVIVAVGLGPALVSEILGSPFPLQVWGYLIVAGIFQAIYHFGLAQGYKTGQFTVVYPVARALPILLVAVIDAGRGHAPSPMAWLGMLLVLAGCVVMPLESLADFKRSYYWNYAMIWIIVTALGTVGYTAVDNAAVELIPSGALVAARYGIFEFALTALFFWLILQGTGHPISGPGGWPGWKWPAIGAIGFFGAYWLILWSYQISPQASYVVALRQFSIVIGVVIGTFLFREPAPGLRIGASLAIVGGIACIALVG